jgi:ferredoxin
MSTNSDSLFEAFLNQHDSKAWEKVVQQLLPNIHEVDRDATQIWFKFYPLDFMRVLQKAENLPALEIQLQLQGTYFLKDQIDSSHSFLYGHAYWPQVKAAVVEFAEAHNGPDSLDLSAQIRSVASKAAKKAKVDENLLVGITAVAFMTLQQVGLAAFKASPGKVIANHLISKKSPDQVASAREKDDSQGLFGFLKGARTEFTVNYNENEPSSRFKIINTQQITTAAANDKRDHVSKDARCTANEGPIPVQCRSAACGTCWVGVIGGREKLSDVPEREGRKIKEFGYINTADPKPLIRLACMAEASGAVTIVIPPWNGVFGKFMKNQQTADAEAQTASKR